MKGHRPTLMHLRARKGPEGQACDGATIKQTSYERCR